MNLHRIIIVTAAWASLKLTPQRCSPYISRCEACSRRRHCTRVSNELFSDKRCVIHGHQILEIYSFARIGKCKCQTSNFSDKVVCSGLDEHVNEGSTRSTTFLKMFPQASVSSDPLSTPTMDSGDRGNSAGRGCSLSHFFTLISHSTLVVSKCVPRLNMLKDTNQSVTFNSAKLETLLSPRSGGLKVWPKRVMVLYNLCKISSFHKAPNDDKEIKLECREA